MKDLQIIRAQIIFSQKWAHEGPKTVIHSACREGLPVRADSVKWRAILYQLNLGRSLEGGPRVEQARAPSGADSAYSWMTSSPRNAPAARKMGHGTVKVRSALTVERCQFMPLRPLKEASLFIRGLQTTDSQSRNSRIVQAVQSFRSTKP